jgi:hypothetical protein
VKADSYHQTLAKSPQSTEMDTEWVDSILASWTQEALGNVGPVALSPRKPPQRELLPEIPDGPFWIAGRENTGPGSEILRWRRRADERRLQAIRLAEEAAEGDTTYVPSFTPLRATDRSLDFEMVDEGDEKKARRAAAFSRRPVSALLTFTGCAVLILILGSWTGGLLRMAPPDKSKDPAISGVAPSVEKVPTATGMVPQMKNIVERFFAARTPEEKASYVRGGEALLPAMQDYYSRNPGNPETVTVDPRVEFVNDGHLEFVRVTGRSSGGDPFEAFVQKTAIGPRIDWRQLTGSGEMDWRDWLRLRPSKPVTHCVIAKIDNYYSGAFSDPAKWVCLKITDIRKSQTVWAYANRENAIGMLLTHEFRNRRRVTRMKGSFEFPAPSPGGSTLNALTPQVTIRSVQGFDWLDRSPEVVEADEGLLSQSR